VHNLCQRLSEQIIMKMMMSNDEKGLHGQHVYAALQFRMDEHPAQLLVYSCSIVTASPSMARAQQNTSQPSQMQEMATNHFSNTCPAHKLCSVHQTML